MSSSDEEQNEDKTLVKKTIADDKRQLVYSMCVCDSSRVTRRKIRFLEDEVAALKKNVVWLQQVLSSDLSALRDLEDEVVRVKKIREEYDGEVEEISQKLDEWEEVERSTLPKVMMTAVEKTLNVLFDTEHKVTSKTVLQRIKGDEEFKQLVKVTTGEILQDWKKDVVPRIMEAAEEELLKAFSDIKV